jgi:hypothetical protein
MKHPSVRPDDSLAPDDEPEHRPAGSGPTAGHQVLECETSRTTRKTSVELCKSRRAAQAAAPARRCRHRARIILFLCINSSMAMDCDETTTKPATRYRCVTFPTQRCYYRELSGEQAKRRMCLPRATRGLAETLRSRCSRVLRGGGRDERPAGHGSNLRPGICDNCNRVVLPGAKR